MKQTVGRRHKTVKAQLTYILPSCCTEEAQALGAGGTQCGGALAWFLSGGPVAALVLGILGAALVIAYALRGRARLRSWLKVPTASPQDGAARSRCSGATILSQAVGVAQTTIGPRPA